MKLHHKTIMQALRNFLFLGLIALSASCQKNPEITSGKEIVLDLPEHYTYTEHHIPDQFLQHQATSALALAFGMEASTMELFQGFGEADRDLFVGNLLRGRGLSHISNAGAQLGRVLFYDPRLSLNNLVSCASCHDQSAAFADARKQSEGFEGRKTKRNSMAILNVGMNQNMFWDSRSPTVRDLVLRPVQDHIEMGMESLPYLEKKLAKTNYYPALFSQAYDTPEVTSDKIADALTQFLASMTTFRSKFDLDREDFTPAEIRGEAIFFSARAKCGSCHTGPNLAAPDFPGGEYGGPSVAGTANIGLDIRYQDPGKGQGKFRIPSLRNVELTAPYMHDGRFETLMQVIDHYDHGVKSHQALDEKLKGPSGLPQRLHLSPSEKTDLIAFLHTLTDHHLVEDERFSNPFR